MFQVPCRLIIFFSSCRDGLACSSGQSGQHPHQVTSANTDRQGNTATWPFQLAGMQHKNITQAGKQAVNVQVMMVVVVAVV